MTCSRCRANKIRASVPAGFTAAPAPSDRRTGLGIRTGDWTRSEALGGYPLSRLAKREVTLNFFVSLLHSFDLSKVSRQASAAGDIEVRWTGCNYDYMHAYTRRIHTCELAR